MEVAIIINTPRDNNIILASEQEPGSSSRAVRINPGKDNNFHVNKSLLQGPVNAGVPGHGREEGAGGAHDQHEVRGQAQDEEVCGGHCNPDQDVMPQGRGQCQAGGGQHQHVGGGQAGDALGDSGGQGGGDDQRREGDVGRLARTLTSLLSAPKDSDSPGWVKTRRRRAPDGLVQRRISHFTILEEKVSSEGVPKIPGGGPYSKESVRGIKRGMDYSMEGPSGIKKRKRKD